MWSMGPGSWKAEMSPRILVVDRHQSSPHTRVGDSEPSQLSEQIIEIFSRYTRFFWPNGFRYVYLLQDLQV